MILTITAYDGQTLTLRAEVHADTAAHIPALRELASANHTTTVEFHTDVLYITFVLDRSAKPSAGAAPAPAAPGKTAAGCPGPRQSKPAAPRCSA